MINEGKNSKECMTEVVCDKILESSSTTKNKKFIIYIRVLNII